MGKRVECSVKRFKGAVEFKDPLPYHLLVKFRAAIQVLKDAPDSDLGVLLIPCILEAVEAWDIPNIQKPLTADNFPNGKAGTSALSTQTFIAWLINEMTAVYKGSEDSDPNE